MELRMWILLVILFVVLTITFVRKLHLRGELERERIKAVMAEKCELQLKVEVVSLRNRVKKLEAERMFDRSLI